MIVLERYLPNEAIVQDQDRTFFRSYVLSGYQVQIGLRDALHLSRDCSKSHLSALYINIKYTLSF